VHLAGVANLEALEPHLAFASVTDFVMTLIRTAPPSNFFGFLTGYSLKGGFEAAISDKILVFY
jgi:hypothetical protein